MRDRCTLRSSVTLFLALTAAAVSALLLALTESARTAGARFYVRNMADSAMDSFFSRYHADLWEQYRILGCPCKSDEEAAAELLRFLRPYADSCGLYAVAEPGVEIHKRTTLTDDGGRWFEQEIMDYLKFGWINLGYTPESAAALLKQIKEAGTMDRILKDYGLKSREAVAMEKSLTKIHKNLEHQEELKQEARDQVSDGDNSAFQRTAEELSRTKDALPELVKDYDRKADRFREQLLKVEERHREDMESLEEVNRNAIKEQIAAYRSYTDQDGERRSEVDRLPEGLGGEQERIASVRAFADETEAYIDSFDDDDEEDGPDIDEDALWEAVASDWDGVGIPSMTVSHGIRNEETESLLETVLHIASGGFLHIVLPPGRTVSDFKMDSSLYPSRTSVTARNAPEPTILTALSVDAYASRYLNSFTDRLERPVSLELEYAAAGKDSDLSNLTQVLTELFAIREALNFLHIMTDSALKEEARAVAETIGALTMVPGLSLLVECLVITAWATLETFMDLRLLLEGKRAALIKRPEDWMTGLADVLTFAVTLALPEEKLRDVPAGQSYEDYLLLLLLPLDASTRNYRIMDMIQLNLLEADPAFRMKDCIYGLSAEVRTESRHLFTMSGLFSPYPDAPHGSFPVSVKTVKAY